LIVTLPAAEKSAFVRGILPFLLGLDPSTKSAASFTASDADLRGQLAAAAKTQYTTMLLSSVLVFLEKASPVFADLDGSDGVLRSCADFALRTQLKDSASPLRGELGVPQLLALIINKVRNIPHLPHMPATHSVVHRRVVLGSFPPKFTGSFSVSLSSAAP
jgi:hypothetical protein